jgi:hypothetical protein
MAPPDPVRPGVVPADGDGIARAVYELRRGQLVAIPTDTVYGLACMASDREATGRIFSLKARPASVNLQVLVADAQSAARITKGWGPRTSALAERFWPGGLTLPGPPGCKSAVRCCRPPRGYEREPPRQGDPPDCRGGRCAVPRRRRRGHVGTRRRGCRPGRLDCGGFDWRSAGVPSRGGSPLGGGGEMLEALERLTCL